MRNIIMGFLILCFSLGAVLTTAEAARFGGGKSFGMSRSVSSNRSSHQSYNAGSPTQKPLGNRWIGPLAGLAAGGLLASLFMGHGLGSGVISWLLVAGVIYLVVRLFTGMQRVNRFQAQSFRNNNTVPFNTIEGNFASSISNSQYAQFEQEAFLRQAKATFIRLQAAYDAKNLADIRAYTSPEIYAEAQLQLQERGDAENFTEVVSIDAELADLEIQSDYLVASVVFSGQIREARNVAPIAMKEIWHFQQLKNQAQWIVAGIQQG